MPWEPFWHTEVKIESGGRYPLGLNSFHDHMDDFLNKGIIHGAYRLQYMAFYCWAIGDTVAELKSPTYSQFVTAFSKRENAFSIGLRLLHPDASIPGDTALREIFSSKGSEYKLSFRLLKSQDMGAYGLYYAGAMFGFGLISVDENGIPTLTELGKATYNALDLELKNTAVLKKHLQKNNAPEAALKAFGEIVDLDFLRQVKQNALRNQFINMVFHLDYAGPSLRRSTFLYYLDMIRSIGSKDIEFSHEVFYALTCFGSYRTNENQVLKYTPDEYFEDIHYYWQIYFLHSQFRWWVDKYFCTFLEHLKGCPDGASEKDFMAEVDLAQVSEIIGQTLNIAKPEQRTILSTACAAIRGHAAKGIYFPGHQIAPLIPTSNRSELIAQMIIFMIGIWARSASMQKDKRYIDLLAHLPGDFWFYRLTQDFPALPDLEIGDWLGKILKAYVLRQHDEITYRKGDLRRRWYTKENTQYYFQADNNCQWGNGHFGTVTHYLHELGLIDYFEDSATITKDGIGLLNKIKREHPT